MITTERLKKLIEQGATIYSKYRSYILKNEEVKKTDFWYRRIAEIKDNKFHYVYKDSDYYEDFDYLIALEDLFETEEDARWELEMTATETLTLKMPLYNVFINASLENPYGSIIFYCNKLGQHFRLYLDLQENKIKIENMFDSENIFTRENTQENYIEACRLCLRLFKGEEV